MSKKDQDKGQGSKDKSKKLKLNKQTLKDLDAPKRIKGGVIKYLDNADGYDINNLTKLAGCTVGCY